MLPNSSDAVTLDRQIAATVVVLRGHKVLLDSDLAALYQESTKRFNEQVRRNRDRFPEELARRFAQLETRLEKRLTGHDQAIAVVLAAIRELMHPPLPKRRPIGFTADLGETG